MPSLCRTISLTRAQSFPRSLFFVLAVLESAEGPEITLDFLVWIFVGFFSLSLRLLAFQIKCALVVPVDKTVA